MRLTKQTTYSWEAGDNISAREATLFANNLLKLLGNPLPFIVSPLKYMSAGLTWEDAIEWCDSLYDDGEVETRWRMPTEKELMMMYLELDDMAKLVYWSSTDDTTERSACAVDTWNGTREFYEKSAKFAVRPVRDI